jgi:large subunit ribosomal protein L4
MALASRIADDEVKLVDGLAVASPKTSVVARFLEAIGVDGATVLVAPEKHDANLWKSARNIDGVSVSPVGELNAWSILRPRSIVMTTAAIDAFRAAAKEKSKPAAAGKAATKRPAAKRAAKKEAK